MLLKEGGERGYREQMPCLGRTSSGLLCSPDHCQEDISLLGVTAAQGGSTNSVSKITEDFIIQGFFSCLRTNCLISTLQPSLSYQICLVFQEVRRNFRGAGEIAVSPLPEAVSASKETKEHPTENRAARWEFPLIICIKSVFLVGEVRKRDTESPHLLNRLFFFFPLSNSDPETLLQIFLLRN